MAHTVDLLYSDTERTLAAALADLLSSRAQPSDVLARIEKPEQTAQCQRRNFETNTRACEIGMNSDPVGGRPGHALAGKASA